MAQNKLPSLDKYGSTSKTETEHTVKLDTKNLCHYPVQMKKIWTNKNQQKWRSKQINQHVMIEVVQL